VFFLFTLEWTLIKCSFEKVGKRDSLSFLLGGGGGLTQEGVPKLLIIKNPWEVDFPWEVYPNWFS